MTEPRPVLTMLVLDRHGRWHIAIDGGYVSKEDAIRAMEFYTTQVIQPTQELAITDGR